MNRMRRQGAIPLPTDLQSSPFDSVSAIALDLERALSKLSETSRVAFVLSEIQQLSVKEVAEILSVPEGTVKSRVHTARIQLREDLRAHDVVRERGVDYVV